jgi:hypothetical protein
MKFQPTRRDFLKFLLATPIATTLDVEKLLWIPEKTIIVLSPIKRLTESQIISIELERITPMLKSLFERDNMFYEIMK